MERRKSSVNSYTKLLKDNLDTINHKIIMIRSSGDSNIVETKLKTLLLLRDFYNEKLYFRRRLENF